HHGAHESGEATDRTTPFLGLIIGSILGGLLFVLLDQLIDRKGGYLRKLATTISYLSQRESQRSKRLLRQLSQIASLRQAPPSEVEKLVQIVRPVVFQPGEKLFNQGDPGEAMYFIDHGRIDLKDDTGQDLSPL